MNSTTIMISLFPIVFVILELEQISGNSPDGIGDEPTRICTDSGGGDSADIGSYSHCPLWRVAGWLVRTVHGSRRASVGSYRAVRHPEELRSGLADSHHHIAILYNSIDTHKLRIHPHGNNLYRAMRMRSSGD